LAEAIRIDAARCSDFETSSRLEWLETNGTGAFAMGTVAGVNTRRYHGLLVATLRPPVARVVTLARLEEDVVLGGERVALSTDQFPGAVSPQGYRNLVEFRLDPFPVWRFSVAGATVIRSLFLVPERQAVVLRYDADRPCRLEARPFLACRDYHSLGHETAEAAPEAVGRPDGVDLRLYRDRPGVRLFFQDGWFAASGQWYRNFEYLAELDRGLDFREDLYTPGVLGFDLVPGEPRYVVAALDGERAVDPALCEAAVRAQRAGRSRLDLAADQFIVRRAGGRPTIIAGYPWFTDWGRDTMISLPGLLVARGRLDEAWEIVEGFLEHLDRGLIPNRFPDDGERPEYNTVDGTLWLFQAVWALEAARPGFAGQFFPKALEILEWHRRGTHYGIRVDEADGLLSAGGVGDQLTWMDAKVGDWVVTPRHGKAVEINALWINALRMTAEWAAGLGERKEAVRLRREAARAERSFRARFWNPARGCLYDRIGPEGPDERVRPNQLFAASLRFPVVTKAQARRIVAVAAAELLTPYGLRTLSPGDPEFKPRYEGDPWHRDGAYHQGTVWPWLLGPYISAYLYAHGRAAVAHCRELAAGLVGELERGGLGSLAEVYDGAAPHRAGGCPAQAWSVAELIRVLEAELA